jgi:hypothetical protein
LVGGSIRRFARISTIASRKRGPDGLVLLPPGEPAGPRTGADARKRSTETDVILSTEEDFELGQAFADVFVRAGVRLMGFLAGCILVAGLWVLWAAL